MTPASLFVRQGNPAATAPAFLPAPTLSGLPILLRSAVARLPRPAIAATPGYLLEQKVAFIQYVRLFPNAAMAFAMARKLIQAVPVTVHLLLPLMADGPAGADGVPVQLHATKQEPEPVQIRPRLTEEMDAVALARKPKPAQAEPVLLLPSVATALATVRRIPQLVP